MINWSNKGIKQNHDEEDVSIGSGLSSSTSGIPVKEHERDFLDSDGEGDVARPSHQMAADEGDSQDDIQFDDGDEEDDDDVDDDDF